MHQSVCEKHNMVDGRDGGDFGMHCIYIGSVLKGHWSDEGTMLLHFHSFSECVAFLK